MPLVPDRLSDNSVTITPGAATGGTITLPSVTNKRHFITAIMVQRTATAALAGTAVLSITTTNLAGSPQWQVGNLMAAGGTQIDISIAFADPLISSVAGTNTTFVFPNPGAAVGWNATVWYTLGD